MRENAKKFMSSISWNKAAVWIGCNGPPSPSKTASGTASDEFE